MADRTETGTRQGTRRREPSAPTQRSRARPAAKTRTESEEIAGIVLTHPDRVLFPEQGQRKRDLAAYYVSIADWMLPHVAGRPLSLVRCPEGQQKTCFFQKHISDLVPEALGRVQVREESGEIGYYPVINDLAGLISLVQMGVLEIHCWGSRADTIERPDRLVFDLDPAEDVTIDRVGELAQFIRSRLREFDLESWVKTTGGKGLHVVVPVLPTREWSEVYQFSWEFAQACTAELPESLTTNPRKAARKGKIFLDYLRNGRGATAIAPYSTRARSGATVATPLRWNELGDNLRPGSLTLRTMARRKARLGNDPWAELRDSRQELPIGSSRRGRGRMGS
jgi:bifunctional non-homologous end joining protein LigD